MSQKFRVWYQRGGYEVRVYAFAYAPICFDNVMKPKLTYRKLMGDFKKGCPIYRRDGSVYISMN